jgi:hypothetical protein
MDLDLRNVVLGEDLHLELKISMVLKDLFFLKKSISLKKICDFFFFFFY